MGGRGQDATSCSLGRTLGAALVGRAMAARRSVERIVVVTRPDRVERRQRTADASAVRTVVAGGERRQDSVRPGVAATDAEVVLVHDGARPLASSALVEPSPQRPPRTWCRDPGRAGRRLAEAVATRTRVRHSVDREGAGPRPDAAGRATRPAPARCAAPRPAARPSPTRRRCSRPRYHGRHGRGEATNIKVTDPADLEIVRAIAAARAMAASPAATASASGGHAPVRARRLGCARRHPDGGRAAPVRPLRRRRGPPRAGHGAPGGGGPRRPRPPLSADRFDTSGIASARCSARGARSR